MAEELKLVVRMRDLATKAMGRVRGGLARIRKAMSAPLGGPLVRFLGGAALAAAATSMLLTAASFEQGMNKVRAITQATDEDMVILTKTARELGATTKFSARQAADGMAVLAQAGFETTQIVSALPVVLDLAAATGLSLAEAAGIASGIVKGFNQDIEELSKSSDILLTATTSVNVTLTDMGEAMKFVGPVASGAGLAFTETAAAVALMGEANIRGGMAGTALRGALVRLLNPTKQESKALQKLGITAKDSTGKLLPLNKIVAQMEGQLKNGMSQAQLTALAMELFGDRAGPAMVALVNQGAEAILALTEKMENSAGVTKRTADIMDTGLNASLLRLKSAWEELSIALFQGEALAGAAAGVDILSEKIRNLAEAVEAGAITGTLQNIVDAFGDFGGSIGAIIEGILFWPDAIVNQFTEIKNPLSGTLNEIVATFSTWQGALGAIVNAVIDFFLLIPKGWLLIAQQLEILLADMTQAILSWILDLGSRAVTAIKNKLVDGIIGEFQRLKDVVVGNSIIPEMVTEIGAEMDRLPSEMIPPTESAVLGVLAELKKLERPTKGKKISTRAAGFEGLDQLIRVSENAATSIMLPIERANFRFAQQMDEFQKNAAAAMKAGLITQQQVNVLEAQLQATHNARIEELEQQHLNQLKAMTQQAVNDQLTPLEQLNVRFEEQMARFNATAALALQQGIITEQEVQLMREQIIAAHDLRVEEMNRTHWEQILIDTQNVQETMRQDMRNFGVDVAQAWTDSIADMIAGTAAGAGSFKKAVGKLLAGMVSQWGQMMVLRGTATIATGLFPFIPSIVAAGGKQIAAGIALKAFASKLGAGGGGVSAGGRGGGGGGGRGRAPGAAPGRESTPDPDRQAVVRIDMSELSDEDIVTNVPQFVGKLVDRINEGAKREIRLDFQSDPRVRREG